MWALPLVLPQVLGGSPHLCPEGRAGWGCRCSCGSGWESGWLPSCWSGELVASKGVHETGQPAGPGGRSGALGCGAGCGEEAASLAEALRVALIAAQS